LLVLVIRFPLPAVRPLDATCLFRAIGGRSADLPDPVRRPDIVQWPTDFLIPDFLGLLPIEPPHRPCPKYPQSIDQAAAGGQVCSMGSCEISGKRLPRTGRPQLSFF